MSSLILPTANQNPTLQKNLDALFKRYPHERSRLELTLSSPVPVPQVAKIEIPPAPSKPPLRIVILAGIGSPLFLADFLNDKTIVNENFEVFIVENNLEALRAAFQHFDLTQIINYPKTHWLLMHNTESIKPALFVVLRKESVASMMYNVVALNTEVPQPPEVSEFYEKLPAIYNETCDHVMHNFGRINDSLEGIRATLMNEKMILDCPGIDEIKNAFKGIPAIVVGAGPSLDYEIETIKANNDKFVVIAADAAMKPLLSAGIRVDYVTSMERLNNYQRPFFEGLEPQSAELVAFPVIHPELVPLFPGKVRTVYRNYSWFAYFEKAWPKGIVKCGGSTSHLAIRLADWLGCSKVFLIGIDSAYEKHPTENLYRSHAKGTGYPEWEAFIPLSEFGLKRQHREPIAAKDVQGNDVMTNMTYYQWIKEYGEELAEIGQRVSLVNCSSKGLPIAGIPYLPFKPLAENLDSPTIKKPETTTQVKMNRSYDHKELYKHLVAWRQASIDGAKECNDLLTIPGEIDPDRYEAVMYVYNFKMCIDSLFISFIVQCCAKEFFELENKFWYLNRDWTQDKREKIGITRERFDLFVSVIDIAIKMFKEAGHGV